MPERFASPEDLDACRKAIRGGSKSFFAASMLLPQDVRDRAYALYGFCRRADDAVDEGRNPAAACQVLRARLAAVYAGQPGDDPFDRAFADVVRDYAIPMAFPKALIEGFAWDVDGRAYDELSDVRAYGARVAGSVGAMMALVMGVRSREALARACDLGVAMQLTNIVRDVGEDARNGRLYLPRSWLWDVGLDPDAFLAEPSFDGRLGSVIARLNDEAERLYRRAWPGIDCLPLACRPAIHAAARIYRSIGRKAREQGFDTVSARVSTGTGRKLALAGASLLDAAWRKGRSEAPALNETAFLVTAVPAEAETAHVPWWRVNTHWGRLVEILHDVGLREQNLQNGPTQSSRSADDAYLSSARF